MGFVALFSKAFLLGNSDGGWSQQYHHPSLDSKLAGRLGFAASVAADEVGRAYAKPLHAQAHAPQPGRKLSSRPRAAVRWWIAFPTWRPPA